MTKLKLPDKSLELRFGRLRLLQFICQRFPVSNRGTSTCAAHSPNCRSVRRSKLRLPRCHLESTTERISLKPVNPRVKIGGGCTLSVGFDGSAISAMSTATKYELRLMLPSLGPDSSNPITASYNNGAEQAEHFRNGLILEQEDHHRGFFP